MEKSIYSWVEKFSWAISNKITRKEVKCLWSTFSISMGNFYGWTPGIMYAKFILVNKKCLRMQTKTKWYLHNRGPYLQKSPLPSSSSHKRPLLIMKTATAWEAIRVGLCKVFRLTSFWTWLLMSLTGRHNLNKHSSFSSISHSPQIMGQSYLHVRSIQAFYFQTNYSRSERIPRSTQNWQYQETDSSAFIFASKTALTRIYSHK